MALKTLTTSGPWATNGNWTPAAKPTATDEVVIPTGKEVKIEALAKCRAIKVDGTGIVAGGSELTVGDGTAPTEAAFAGIAFKLSTEATWSHVAPLNFISTSATVLEILSGLRTINSSPVKFSKAGKWKLGEDLIAVATIQVQAGTVETNGKKVECAGLEITGATTNVSIASSTIKCTGTGTVWSVEEAAPAPTTTASTIEVTSTSATEKTFNGGGKTYATLILLGGNIKVEGSNTFSTLSLKNAGKEATKFAKGSTQTVTTFTVDAAAKAGSLVKMESSEAGKEWKLTKASGNVNVDFIEVKDSHVDASPKWYGGPSSHSTYGTGDLNWLEEAEPGGAIVGKATGAILLSGSAVPITRSVVSTKATGSLLLTGTSTGTARNVVAAKATGSLLFTGTATATIRAVVSGKASGELLLTGTAKGSVAGALKGKATGALLLSGTSAGTMRAKVTGKATGALVLTGTSTGHPMQVVLGKATGSFVLTGTAKASLASNVAGHATGVLLLTGSAHTSSVVLRAVMSITNRKAVDMAITNRRAVDHQVTNRKQTDMSRP